MNNMPCRNWEAYWKILVAIRLIIIPPGARWLVMPLISQISWCALISTGASCRPPFLGKWTLQSLFRYSQRDLEQTYRFKHLREKVITMEYQHCVFFFPTHYVWRWESLSIQLLTRIKVGFQRKKVYIYSSVSDMDSSAECINGRPFGYLEYSFLRQPFNEITLDSSYGPTP